ncbi:MAG: MAPEG family protein [Steroidobacteraceae bacterium]
MDDPQVWPYDDMMNTDRSFRLVQRGVAISMLAAVLLTAGAFVVVDRHWPPSANMPIGERLLIAAKTDLIVVLWLAIAIADVARRRFISPLDIMGSSEGEGSRQIRNANAFLQNTLEQVAVAVPAHFALAAFYPGSPAIVPALGALFSLGRLLFWIGYPRGPVARAFGFAISFYPSIGALIACGFALLAR